MLDHLTPKQRIRFISRIDQSGGPDACWPWMGCLQSEGYGEVRIGRPGNLKTVLAHRLAYVIVNGEFPEDRPFGLHECDNPKCCNPKHIFPGTRGDNNKDRHSKGRSGDHKGEANGRAKLTVDDVRAIRLADKNGEQQKSIATRYNTTHRYINAICRKRAWAHID